MAHARPQPGRGQAARHGPRPRSRPACLQAPEFSPCPCFPGAARGKPSSIPAVDPGHLAGALVRHRIRKGDRAPVDPRRARLPCHHPPLPRWAPLTGVRNGAAPAARAPQSRALRPGSRLGCPPAGQTPFYFWFLAGASPRRAGQLLAGRGCRASRPPVPPPGTRRESGHAWSCGVEGNGERANEVTNKRIFETFYPLLFGRRRKLPCGEASDFRGNSLSQCERRKYLNRCSARS